MWLRAIVSPFELIYSAIGAVPLVGNEASKKKLWTSYVVNASTLFLLDNSFYFFYNEIVKFFL